jgi:colicin import membrane protein
MAKAVTDNRLPRGTKVVARAFFDAANGYPEAARSEIIKAALGAIHDELKAVREKAMAAKAKAKATAPKVAKTAAKSAAGKSPVAEANKAAPKKATAPAKMKAAAKKKAAPKKGAAKKAKGPVTDVQAIADALDVAETTSPEVSSA